MTKRLTIAVDIDDVLARQVEGLVAFSNQRWGTALTVDDYDEDWGVMWGVNLEERTRRAAEFHNLPISRSYGCVEGAYEVLQRLSRQHHLIIVTSRRLQMKADTFEWLDDHFPGIFSRDDIHFTGIWDNATEHSAAKTKGELIEKIGADVLIDDQLKHCLAVAETGRCALLFGVYNWNRQTVLPAGVERVVDWVEVEKAIERIAEHG